MTKRIGTPRTKTRHIFSVPKNMKGKLTISKFIQKLSPGDKVVLKASPGVQKGLYHHRFHGRTGSVVGSIKKYYEVKKRDKKKFKTLLINPVYLVKIKVVENGTKNN